MYGKFLAVQLLANYYDGTLRIRPSAQRCSSTTWSLNLVCVSVCVSSKTAWITSNETVKSQSSCRRGVSSTPTPTLPPAALSCTSLSLLVQSPWVVCAWNALNAICCTSGAWASRLHVGCPSRTCCVCACVCMSVSVLKDDTPVS